MNAAKLKRTGIRSSFTRTANALKEELIKDEIDINVLKDKFTKLQNLHIELRDLDDKYLDLILEGSTSEDEVTREIESREVYSDDFITLSRQINDKLQTPDEMFDTKSNDGASSISGVKSKSYKLPKIELKKFDGEFINWLPFWSQFDKIHNDPDLHDSDKFAYLVQSMKAGTRAKEFIESYPVTSENYEKAVFALRERFGKPELLIEVYVRELIKLIISNVKAESRDKLPLDKLYDKIEAQLRALESLGLKAIENSSWLFPMVESSLTEDILRAWQRSPLFNLSAGEGANLSRLTNLMSFLKAEVEGEERLKLARSGFGNVGNKEGFHSRAGGERGENKNKFRYKKSSSANIPTAAGFLTTQERVCIFCDKGHESKNCYNARSLSLDDKLSKVREKQCCLKCLEPHHMKKFCKQFVRCYFCGKQHVHQLCPDMHSKTETVTEQNEIVQATTAKANCISEIALMTLVVRVAGVNKTKDIRVLLDCGSQKSYILKSLAVELGLPVVSQETITHTLFGGARTDPKLYSKYHVKLGSSKPHKCPDLEFDFLDQNVICGDIPRVAKGPILEELKKNHIWLSDMGANCPKIEMLIGSDIYGKILTGQIKQLKGGLTAICTKLGWAVCGTFNDSPILENENNSVLCTNLAIRDLNISDLWNLETIGISDPRLHMTKAVEENMAQQQFLESLKRNEEGRYCVSLPWLGSSEELPSNRHVAEKRLFSVTTKLKSLNKFEDYDKVFKEWMEEGVIEIVPNNELNCRSHYLPHHPVFKPDSVTSKIRPVFDASCKMGRAPSLNDCLIKGPNLIEEIPSILLRFREKRIGVTSDIRRAFLQIEIEKEDRDFLRFLWWEKNNEIRVLRHTRVVFGVTSSPFLLGGVIAFHLSQTPKELSSLSQKLAKSFYVDNCVTSVDSEEELKQFIKFSVEVLAQAKMDLRMWVFGPVDNPIMGDVNMESVLDDSVPVLGIQWDRKEDNLSIAIKTLEVPDKLSKREILSLTQSVYDPLGFLTPVLLIAKLLLQEIWELKVGWDTPLPDNVKSKFVKWYCNLQFLNDVRLPRRIGFGFKDSWSLHTFCDASQLAYATVIFLRCEYNGEIFVNFVAAKSRVAPLKGASGGQGETTATKGMTIPRLELMACVLGVRLSKYVSEALSIEDIPKYFWTDSTTALFWIKNNDLWGTFVGNRVREICTVSNANQWSFVPGQLNPADLPSRGCSPSQFVELDWFRGPMWLKDPIESWPQLNVKPDDSLVFSERKKGVNLIVNVNTSVTSFKWYQKFSQFTKVVRILGWIKRFISKCRNKIINSDPFLSAPELQEAKATLLSLVQAESFPESGNSVRNLQTVRDENGVIRVKTKIIEREDEFSFRYPMLLPAKHHIVDILVREFHLQNSHAGVQALISMLREEYWILSARRVVKSVVRHCVRCQRYASKPPETLPIHLPLDRVRDACTFEVTGVDLCGPLVLRNKTKAWVVLFTCAVYRCVHLELVTAISTEYFIQAFRRFIARRGRPTTIYSDNGTNFVGTASALRKVDWEKVVSQDTLRPITWKFIPPTAAWWGGWWERLIRSTKGLLLRVLGQSSVNYEELLTIICDVEAVLNSRPLTYVSNDVDDLSPLTPAMFMQDIKVAGTADLDSIDRNKLLVRQRMCQELREQFRSRFRNEYLSQLVQRSGQKDCDIHVGDMVLVGAENIKRINWPIARVQELCMGRDGRVRVVKVKTKNGVLVPPVRKLYKLEICSCKS